MAEQTWTERIDVDAPAEEVWRAMIDVTTWPTWTGSMDDVTVLDPGPLREGSSARVSQPRLPVTVWTVSELTPGRSFSWRSRRPGVRTVAEHDIRPDGEGCAVTLVVRQSGPLAGVSARLFGGLVRRYMRMEAEGLKRRVESGVP